MRRSIFTLLLALLSIQSFAQDFSNKGKEFWLVFPDHIPSGNATAQMGLFFTSDKNSSGTISVNGYNTTFTVTANQVTGPVNIPYFSANIGNSSAVVNKGIHVVVNAGQPAVVLYAHIYAGNRSEASLILPVNTLGKKYYSTNFYQISTQGSQSQFNIVAVEANTVVQYTLRKNGVLDLVGTTITLPNPGDQVQIQDDLDLSGSIIESIASGTGTCKKIAVFSGSSSVAIQSNSCNGNSYDPLFQQCYPVSTWGKNFGIVPLANNSNGFHIRVMASENNTIVNFNGTSITLNAGQYYPVSEPNPTPFTEPMVITGNKPITVSQYMMCNDCTGSNNIPGQQSRQGDPDMIILNPVEQNISDINIFSSNLQNIHSKFLNVYIKTAGSASFRINGGVPNNAFIPMPQNNGFSYLQETLTAYPSTSFRLTADSGFNAITYGMGDAESYAYSAGTNVKDLYQQVGTLSQYGIDPTPSVCAGSPFKFKVSLPYMPDSMYWDLTPAFPAVLIKPLLAATSIPFDSTTILNGKQVWWYSLPANYIYNTVGTFPIKITVYKQAADGCGNQNEIPFDLEVSGKPSISFAANNPRCVAENVQFTESTTSTKPVYKWSWNFGDPGSGAANVSAIANPSHTFSAPGTYRVRYSSITTAGCLSDTIPKDIIVAPLPAASVAGTKTVCAGTTPSPTITFTATGGAAPFTFTYTINGGSPQTVTTANGNNTATVNVPVNVAGTFKYTITNVQNTGSALCTKAVTGSATVIVLPLPAAIFVNNAAAVCQNSPTLPISFVGQNGTPPYTFVYNLDGGANKSISTTGTASSVTIQVPTNVPGTRVYSMVSVQDANACVKALNGITVTRRINALPEATIIGDKILCVNGIMPRIIFTGTKGEAPYEFTYKINNSAATYQVITATGKDTVSVAVPANIAGTLTYSLVSVKENGESTCAQSQAGSVTVVINPSPAADFTNTSPLCQVRTINFNSTASSVSAGSVTKWEWNFGDAASGTLNISGIQNPQHVFAVAKTYTVTLKVTSDKGCASTVTSGPLIINTNPKAGFKTPEVCLLDPLAQFTDSTVIAGNASITAWQWNFGDANSTPGNPNISSTQNPVHKYTAVGRYTVQLISLSNVGCRDTVNHTLFINDGNPVANIVAVNKSACGYDSVGIQNKSTIASGNITRLEIFWDDATPLQADENPVLDKVYKHKYAALQSGFSKTYNVRLRVYSGGVCFSEKSVAVTVNAAPKAVASDLANVCLSVPAFRLVAGSETSSVAGTGTYTGAGVVPVSPGVYNFDPALAGQGLHAINYKFTTNAGCDDSAKLSVTVYSVPTVDAGPGGTVLAGGSITLQPRVTGDNLQYLWLDNKYLNNNKIKSPVASPVEDITYTLTVTGRGECSASDTVSIKVLQSPKIPNTFSPNNDGINDFWQIKFLDTYTSAKVQVFTRTGKLVFESYGYAKPWDGNSNGRPLPVDTYYYIIEPESGRKAVTGFVTIIK